MADRKNIEALIEKYFDGDTSNSEERRLRRYMAGAEGDIPEEWRALKALFAYEDAARRPAARGARLTFARRAVRYAAVAAAAAMIAIPVVMHRRSTPSSYVVIDGKVYTDKHTVMKEAENALMLVTAGEDDPFEALSEME